MAKITQDSLMTLEAYAKARPAFRAQVMAHKKDRLVQLGGHVSLYFEDELTMRYQVQEMLRAERIFEQAGIEEEIAAYNPMVPDGSNWKATMMIEYPDEAERQRRLVELKGIETNIWVAVEGHDKVYAISDEDLERENETKTSAVHFQRFELSPDMVAAVKRGAPIQAGVDHPAYRESLTLAEPVRASLAGDLA